MPCLPSFLSQPFHFLLQYKNYCRAYYEFSIGWYHSRNLLFMLCDYCVCCPGEYCEVVLDQPCPTNWWGYPVCGPCHCNVDKGYDGDCNKTTGECRCEVSCCYHCIFFTTICIKLRNWILKILLSWSSWLLFSLCWATFRCEVYVEYLWSTYIYISLGLSQYSGTFCAFRTEGSSSKWVWILNMFWG